MKSGLFHAKCEDRSMSECIRSTVYIEKNEKNGLSCMKLKKNLYSAIFSSLKFYNDMIEGENRLDFQSYFLQIIYSSII